MPDDEPGGAPPVPSDADFASLIERARAAHVAEVERLRLEAQLLRRELLAARGELGEPPGPGLAVAGRGSEARAAAAEGREEAEDALPEAAELRSSSPRTACSPTHAQRSSTSSRGLGRKLTGERVGLDRGRLWALVTKPEFEATFAVMILANALLIVLEAQYKSFSLATSTGHGSAIGESADVWPVAEDVFGVLSWAFGTVFLLELVLKVAALRFDFVTDAWNWMDSIVVLAWFFSEVLQVGANVQFLRVFRLVRLARFARVLKLISRGRSDGLFIMGIALADSIPTTVWVFLSLLVVHCLLALGMNEFLCTVYFDSDSSEAHEQVLVYEYFGSFSRAFLTMTEITFGNFIVPVRVLVEQVNEAFTLYAVIHKIILGYSILGVLNAIFIQETFRAASMNDGLMVRQQQKRQEHHERKMRLLFNEADVDGSGALDMDEWMTVCQDDWVQVWLASQDIKVEDARSLFELMDDGDGVLTADELVKGTAMFKGASAMIKVMMMVHRIEGRVKLIGEELLAERREKDIRV